MDMLEKIIKEIKEKTAKEYIRVIAENSDEMTQFDSKFGGVPYIPNNFEYPYSKTNPEQPLKLLAQINFSEIPEIEEFKHLKGILQFYINPVDDLCGSDFATGEDVEESVCEQKNYRVIYHENVDYNADNTDEIPDTDSYEEFYFPIDAKELKISFEKSIDYLSLYLEESDEFIKEIYNKYSENKIDDIFKLNDEEWNILIDELEKCGHKMGGYPNFIQGDERNDYDFLLLQMDSEFKENNYEILWGDCGTAQFFINEENLKNLDFSDVFYTWACY